MISELTKAFAHGGREAPLYFWRDSRGHEIDILVDLGDLQLPIEVKSGMTVSPDAVDVLKWWCELRGNPTRTGILVRGGEETFMLKGMRILPWYMG